MFKGVQGFLLDLLSFYLQLSLPLIIDKKEFQRNENSLLKKIFKILLKNFFLIFRWENGRKSVPFLNLYKILRHVSESGGNWKAALNANIAQ